MYSALLMAGPPHRGKSVLSSALYKKLLAERRACYLFKATPDGDGQWYQESRAEEAQRQRDKRPWDEPFLLFASEIVAGRPLPFLVDAGGRPTPEQARAIFPHCTHAIIVAGDAQEGKEWREQLASAGVALLATVESRLDGEPALLDEGIPLRVRLVGLERWGEQDPLANEAGAALVRRVSDLFSLTEAGAWADARASAPASTTAENLDAWLLRRTGATRWRPDDLPALLASLPLDSPLALYGGRPNWLLAAIAAHSARPLTLFDAQVGWLAEPALVATEGEGEWAVVQAGEGWFRFTLRATLLRPAPYLAGSLPLPPRRLVLDGRLPRWLLAALVRHYAPRVEAMAVYDPRGAHAIEVWGAAVGTWWP